MPETPNDAERERAASDPSTPQTMLADLAYDHPELRVAIAQNPSTYEGLLEWLRDLGDPAVRSALAQRVGQPPIAEPPRTLSVPSIQRGPSPQACRQCGSLLRPSANYCGSCGTLIPGRTPFSTIGDLTPQANRAVFYTSVAALAVVVIIATSVTVVNTVIGVQNAAYAGGATLGAGSTRDSGTPVNTPQPSTEPSEQPTPRLPALGAGFTADDPSLYNGLASYGDDIDLRSPSGNIHCGLDLPTNPMGSGIGCYLDRYTYTPPQPNPCISADGPDGAAYGGMWSLDANGEASADCYQGMQFGGGDNTRRILPYGHSLTYNGYIFISESTGMSVYNISTRHGIKLNLSSWTKF